MDSPRALDAGLVDARLLQRDLTEAFSLPQPASQAESLDEVRRLCGLARTALGDSHCHALLDQIERYAQHFFPADDDVCWAWHTPQRYARLRALLLQLVGALGRRLKHLEAGSSAAACNAKAIESRWRLSRANLVGPVAAPEPSESPAGQSPQPETPPPLPR